MPRLSFRILPSLYGREGIHHCRIGLNSVFGIAFSLDERHTTKGITVDANTAYFLDLAPDYHYISEFNRYDGWRIQ